MIHHTICPKFCEMKINIIQGKKTEKRTKMFRYSRLISNVSLTFHILTSKG